MRNSILSRGAVSRLPGFVFQTSPSESLDSKNLPVNTKIPAGDAFSIRKRGHLHLPDVILMEVA